MPLKRIREFYPFKIRNKFSASFTLNELLITIAVLAILVGAVVIVLNPGELLAGARDSKRISELNSLAQAITLHSNSIPGGYKGEESTVYISLPDTSTTCSNLLSSLPSLPTGWSYNCVPEADLRKPDGSGWLPVNLSAISGGSPWNELPIDPENKGELFYLFSKNDDGWALSTAMESEKYSPGSSDKPVADGGVSDYKYEIGSNFSVLRDSNPSVISNGNFDSILSGYSPGWDTSLNLTYRPSIGYSSGYNAGVTNPSVGYHAHIIPDCGINNSPCMSFIDRNASYGYAHRWLGTAQAINSPGVNYGWTAGTVVTVKLMVKVDDIGKPARFGLYHWSIANNRYEFGSAIVSIYLPSINKWQKVSYSFTIDSDWELNSHVVNSYLYGNYGSEATMYHDSVEITYKNPN